jgi:ribosomal protein L40E
MAYTALVIFIIVAYVFMYLSMTALVVWPLYADARQTAATLLVCVYTFLWLMTMWSYKLCVEVHPGRPPSDYVPPGASESALREERQRALSESLPPADPEFDRLARRFQLVRFCRPCGAFKPPRAAHCKQCKQCISMYDHHCPFIGACLGYRNRKAFQLFLWYTVVGSSFSFALYCWRLIVVMSTLSRSMSPGASFIDVSGRRYLILSMIMIILQFVILVVVIFSVGSLAFHQINMLLLNTTSIEYRQYRNERRDAVEAGRSFRWRFDHGSGLANFKDCMGSSVWQMWIPTVPAGDSHGSLSTV